MEEIVGGGELDGGKLLGFGEPVVQAQKKHKVITYLGEWFGAPDRIRLSYALDVDKIEEGLKRVGEYLDNE